MSSTATRTLRGALAGAAAAARLGGAAAARPPRVRRPYDDAELLGRLVVALRRLAGRPASACTSPTARCSAPSTRTSPRRCPVPPALRGPLAGLAEHLATWPGTARDRARAPRARATCRSCGAPAARSRRRPGATLLFGLVLGELERRLNPPRGDHAPVDDATSSTNGHGSVEHLVAPGPGRALSRRVLITGASGFAGAHLAAACRAAGDDVVALSRGAGERRRRPAATRTPARAAVAAAAPATSSTTSPRSRTSAAPGASRRRRSRDNQAMTLNVLEAVRAEAPGRACVVAVSSGEVYGPPATLPVDERAPLRPQNPYAVSKAAGDLLAGFYADAHGLRVVRAARVQPRRAGAAAALRARLVRAPGRGGAGGGRRPDPLVTGNPDARRDFTDVRDVVRAYRLLGRGRRARRLQRLLRPLAPRPRELVAGARRGGGGARSSTSSTPRSCARTR